MFQIRFLIKHRTCFCVPARSKQDYSLSGGGSTTERELHDDYAFLDEDEDLEDEDVMIRSPNGIPTWQRNQRHKRDASPDVEDDDDDDTAVDGDDIFEDEINADLHVVFKRKDSSTEHGSDYRKFLSTFIILPLKQPRPGQ